MTTAWDRRVNYRRELTELEIMSVSCPICKREKGLWCVHTGEMNLLTSRLHSERRVKAIHALRARDYNKATKRVAQVRADLARFNEQQRELGEWIHGARLYVWLREYGSILWEEKEMDRDTRYKALEEIMEGPDSPATRKAVKEFEKMQEEDSDAVARISDE
jgi:hypothetical protein